MLTEKKKGVRKRTTKEETRRLEYQSKSCHEVISYDLSPSEYGYEDFSCSNTTEAFDYNCKSIERSSR